MFCFFGHSAAISGGYPNNSSKAAGFKAAKVVI
jgi:hypothetical protein